MRVVSEIQHPRLKITIFHHNAKYNVQFEDGNLKQQYVIREGDDISSVEDVHRLVNDDFIQGVITSFGQMRALWQERLLSQVSEDDFEEII